MVDRNVFEVERGQVWVDNNPRGKGRLLRVVQVDESFPPRGRARCELVTDRGKGQKSFVYIRLDRFDGSVRGYSRKERTWVRFKTSSKR